MQTERIVGGTTGLAGVLERVDMVSRSNAPVLLFGETGTGKEVVARLIHQESSFRHGPFRRVNCGAIPSELIDSELFGHEKGAFTGALSQRQGWFEQADGGTLFLDEVGELSLPAQVRLLRVVQDGEVVRVGGDRPVRVKVRLVAATHRDLPEMVEDRTFRDDLYYRLAVFPVVIPPLRDRLDDIREFAEYFARRASDGFGVRPVPITEQHVRLLKEYRWPGNVREMSAVVDRAVLLGQGRSLEIAAALGRGGPSKSVSPEVAAALALPPAERIVTLDQAIRRHIELALAETRGRIEGADGAARLLDVNPHTLRARMRKLGIDWAAFRAGDR
jgi:transcriptional regulator with GAF, ATPase, and Fis domain